MAVELHTLKTSRITRRKRVGRGNSAGQGTYAGRGLKGQHARSGGNIRPGFEGGRTSLILQTPKIRGKGFKSFRPKVVAVNVRDLNVFKSGEIVSEKTLKKRGIIKSGPVKILGHGELRHKLEVRVPVSSSAKKKIEQAGGKVVSS